jgi:hypothetical protein
LIQGSVQGLERAIPRERWQESMIKTLGEPSDKWEMPPSIKKRADELAAAKFSQPAHNQRR